MGSEHYCLRWNNHQSNLLGVFSQLLESESLVDVTLACTEGPSIRAHKVVLSACSSYFQALFLDHPNRHPIVILKDVRFTELRTLVDFMYKGEVNVEYCQLSALLKTAESLKVKGLADMTNINAAVSSRDDQQQQGVNSNNDAPRDACSRDPEGSSATKERVDPRDALNVVKDEPQGQPPAQQQQTPCPLATSAETIEAVDMTECPSSSPVTLGPSSPCLGPLALDRPRDSRRDDSEDAGSLEETRGSLSPISVHSGPSDMSLSNNTTGSNVGAVVAPPLAVSQASRLPSPHSTEPLAGPSGLPPVQQVPLSLKKEVDWDRSTEERSASSEISDYRLPPDPVSLALGLEAGGWGSLLERASEGTGGGSGNSLLNHSGFVGLASLARRCGVCLATFPSSWLLERHALLQHSSSQPNDDKPFTCEQCGQRYRYRSAYVKHREQNHRARLPADKLFTCDVCGMQFRYLKSFKKHRLNHALERLQRSNELNANTVSSNVNAERSDQVSSTGEPVLEPAVSEGGNLDPETAEHHQDVVSESLQRRTDVNDAEDNGSAVEDERIEPTEGTTTTTSTTTTTTSSGSSSSHATSSVLSHLIRGAASHHHDSDRRERRFACPFCGKCVRSKENLKLHVRKHTGERPFVCLFCGRAFGGKSDLTRHLRIHTGERPYHCEMCGKCFARADYLSKHLTTHIHQR